MRKIKRLVSNRALQYLRGANDYQFKDRISKVVGDCIDQINEFFDVLANVQDGKDGKDGKDGSPGTTGADGHTPYIQNDYWYINGVNTGVKAKGEGGGVSSWNDLEDKPNWLDIVSISDSTGILTEEQLALVSTNHCIVSYNGVYYYKTSSTSTLCIYSKLQAVITEVDIIQHRIEINLTTGAYTYVGTEYDRLVVSGNVASSESDITLQTLKIGNVTYKIPNDTNTHRPIQVSGVQILGNNDTPINFEAGSNVTITSEDGTITISSANSGGGSGENNIIEGIKISGENDVITPDSKIVTIPIMIGSGSSHRSGLVPDPGSTAGTSKYLREDGTWQVPPDNNTTYSASDFDIKDLADSTSLRDGWNGKQDTLVFNTTYNASSNKVATMSDIPSLANYVQKSETAGLIKNDGTVDTTAYGTYSKPSAGIPAADLALGVIPTVPTISTNITTDATSDIKTASPKAVKTYVDTLVGAIDSISIETSLPASGACSIGTYYRITISANTTITLPIVDDVTPVVKSIVIFATYSAAALITFASENSPADSIYYQDGFKTALDMAAADDMYEINCQWNGASWIIAGVKIVAPSS